MENIVERKLLKMATSTGLIIPKAYAEELGLEPGNPITIELCEDGLVIKAAEYEEEYEDDEE